MAENRQGHTDRGFIQANLEITRRANSSVAGQQHQGACCNGMSRTGGNQGLWVTEHPQQHVSTFVYQRLRGLWTFLKL